jgi:nicotinamidase-related amidase
VTSGKPRAAGPTRLERERTALVVVDLQEKLLPTIAESERVLHNSLLLLRLAQVLELPVVLTTQYRKGLGATVPEVVAAVPGVEPLDKVSFGCFGSEDFLARLRALGGRDQLLVAGIESHICVAQTVLGALEHGYQVHVASDAVGSRGESNRQVGLSRMERAGALVSSAEMAVYELLARSDGRAFKQMLPHLKG